MERPGKHVTAFHLRKCVKTWRRRMFELFGSDRYSRFALNEIDRKLEKHLRIRNGVFIEAGANDGLSQSNTYWFERFRNWRGLLIEPIPAMAKLCRHNRPKAIVVNSALVATPDVTSVRMKTANLMAFVSHSFADPKDEKLHLENAISVQRLSMVDEIEVPARTLSAILDELKIGRIDLFSLDVEGYEVEVLRGLDVSRHRPAHILVETKKLDAVLMVLSGQYETVDQLSDHDYLLRAR